MTLLLSTILNQKLHSQIHTLYNSSNTYIASRAAEVDTVGIIWWKCASMKHGELFNVHLSHTGLGDSDVIEELNQWSFPWDCTQFTSYIQKHNGIIIEGVQIRENWNPLTNNVLITTGKILEDLHIPFIPRLTESEALANALDSIGPMNYAWEDDSLEYDRKQDSIPNDTSYYPKGELVYTIVGDFQNIATNYRLAWKFTILSFDDSNNRSQTIWVDAHSGEIVKTAKGCSGTFNHIYYGSQYLDTRWYGGLKQSHFLWSNDNGSNIKTKNANVGLQRLGNFKIGQLPDDADDNWGNNFWAQTSAHHVVSNAWNFYRDVYGRNGLDNNNNEIRILADDNGLGQNAQFARQFHAIDHDFMRFGRGQNNGSDHYTATYDIGGHEFTHGVAFYTLASGFGFIGELENGAIDESYADIFGFMCERHIQTSTWDWLMGEDIIGLQTRDFENPTIHPSGLPTGAPDYFPAYLPDEYGGTNYYTRAADAGGIHINCSVQNHCFYLLAMGGTKNGVTVHGIGIDKAAKIAYAALMNFAESNETFMKSRQHWKAAATKLYGECSNEWIETCNAWAAVKVGTSCGPCLTYTPCYRCKSEIVQPLGVKDYSDITNKLGSIRIYMNPTDGIIQVDLPEFTNGDFELAPPNYLIFCSTGSQISSGICHTKHTTLDLTALKSGVYFIRFEFSGKTEIRTIVKL